ncbi:MAG: TolC family protein [Muribaculaceae bacterium]|nr:TolC family protein [Muribaculaceae bacterium]
MKRQYIIPLMVAAVALSASAQKTWTYADCVEYARLHNISLQKSRLSEQTSEYTLDESKAQWQPSLDFSTTQGLTNHPWGDGTKNSYNSTYGFNAGWTLYNGGRRENTIKQNKLNVEINRFNTADIMRTLETDLLQVYMNILYAKESIGIYEEAVKVSKAQAERAYQLMEAGKLSRVDYAQLDAQYEQDKYNLVNAQTTYDSRRMELKKLLQLGIDTEITPAMVEWSREQVVAELPSIDESYQLAIATDAKIKGLDLSQDVSELDIAIAKGERMPQISLNAGVGTGYYASGGSFGTGLKQGVNENIGLSLSIPILDNKKASTAIAKAKVSQLNAQLDIDQRETELAQTVENWYIDARSAQSRFRAAESQLESAKLSDELTNERFQLGYVNITELMTAHNSYIEAGHSVLQAKYMAMLGQKMIEYYRNATVTLP